MGDPRKPKRKAETPRRVWDSERIKTESALIREYGLKKTRELWSTLSELKKVRRTARHLLSAGEEGREQGQKIIAKLNRLGVAKAEMGLEDVLSLSVRDFLERRLQTLVIKKGLARTPRQARQLITHGFIAVNGRRVTIPSYVVTVSEEPTVSYFKAIDISLPEEEPKSGAAAARAARQKAAKEAATDAPAPAAEKPAEGAAA